MSNRIFKSLFVFSLGLIVLCAFASTAQAQIAKSGTEDFVVGFKPTGTVLQLEGDHIFWTGSFIGAGHNPNSNFLTNHSWECWGTNDINKGMGDAKGYCTVTDTDGDHIFVKWGGTFKLTVPLSGVGVFYGGTGTYEGISGRNEYSCITVANIATSCTNHVKYTIN